MRAVVFHLLFFFSSRRRHTRFSRDWSSDVCSSDLGTGARGEQVVHRLVAGMLEESDFVTVAREIVRDAVAHQADADHPDPLGRVPRSEERRVGKEWRSRWWGER